MFSKIKDVMNAKGEVDKVNRQVKDHKKDITELKSQLESLNSKLKEQSKLITEFTDRQKSALEQSEQSSAQLKDIAAEFQHELDNFKVMKSQVQNKIIDEVSHEFKKELSTYIEKVKKDIDSYNSAKDNAEKTLKQLTLLNQNLEAINAVASKIKQEDFELTKFSNKILAEDRNKLELMRRIDTLEKLIAQIRRNPNR